MKHTLIILSALALLQAPLHAQKLPVDVSNTVRVEYDDNIYTAGTSSDKQDSFKLINELQILLDSQQQNTYYGFRYAPSVVWFEDRSGESTDVNHSLDLILDHSFSPRSAVQLKNTLRYAQEPEVVESDVTLRNRNDFLYNSFNAGYRTHLVPNKTFMNIDARYAVMRYSDDEIAVLSDYDQLVVGADVRQRVAPNTDAGGQIRYTLLDYDTNFRDVDSIQVGAVFSRIFNPKLSSELRGGVEFRDADQALDQTSETPYVDATFVYLVSEDTRFTGGLGYSKDLSPLNRFAQQDRTRVHAAVSNRVSAATTLHLSASYSMGSFDLDDATAAFDPDVHTDGDENILQFAARLAYRLNVRSSFEAAYSFTELDSDVRPTEDFDRNRVSLAWKYDL